MWSHLMRGLACIPLPDIDLMLFLLLLLLFFSHALFYSPVVAIGESLHSMYGAALVLHSMVVRHFMRSPSGRPE